MEQNRKGLGQQGKNEDLNKNKSGNQNSGNQNKSSNRGLDSRDEDSLQRNVSGKGAQSSSLGEDESEDTDEDTTCSDRRDRSSEDNGGRKR